MSETQIDPNISSWVLDFLVRQPIEDRILMSLLTTLPISEHNFLLKKLCLFRKIESEVSNCTVSEKVLEFFHQIDELDKCLGSKESNGYLKKAFCDVAVECSVRCLRSSGNDVKGEFFDLVKRVWRGQVRVMEREGSGLVSEELLAWRGAIEDVLWEEDQALLNLVQRSGDVNAREAVMVYLREERARMGPSFLELVVETLKSKEGVIRARKGGHCEITCDKGKTVVADTGKKNSMTRRKHAARKHPRGAKITNVDRSGGGPSCNSHILDSPEVERVQEALESSRLDLHAVVKDPLPEALHLAEAASGVANKDLEPPGVQIRGVDNALDVQSGEEKAECSRQTNSPKNLMGRKETAWTFKWDDSIGDSSGELSDSSTSTSTSRPHLPTPRARRVSPLNVYKEQKLKKQRKNKRWSVAEEDALRAGVEKYGKGYWKLILNQYKDIFDERTEVDLKDKWRNMTRFN